VTDTRELIRRLELGEAVVLAGQTDERPWREAGAHVVTLREDPDGRLDLCHLEYELRRHADRPVKIGVLAAASHLTGILNDVGAAASALHRHGALAVFDYAVAGRCLPVDVAGEDAIVLGEHRARRDGDELREREHALARRALAAWGANPHIEILGSATADRLAIFSVALRPLDASFVVAALRDLFGLPAVPVDRAFVRLSFDGAVSDEEFDYAVDAVDLLAREGWKLEGREAVAPPADLAAARRMLRDLDASRPPEFIRWLAPVG
jgi:selenocysteine lyase/cysteine desulfurase